MAGIHDEATAIAADLAELRHSLHREPEIGLDLPLTQAKVLGALDGLPLEIRRGKALSSVTAVLRGGQPGKTVLLRGDMDALPVTERTGVPFSSQVAGAMHACGHDLHTTMLAGAARLLSARQAGLPGNVVFMFQPGEEGCFGAPKMIEEGVLDAAGERPVAAYGLHVMSGHVPAGVFTSKPGPMMAAADRVYLTVCGRGGHASQPHHAADPIPVACEIVLALQSMVTRQFDIFDPVVVTVGMFRAGTTDNVIPDEAKLSATIRTFSAPARAHARESVLQLARDIATAHRLSVEAEFVSGYPLTVNDATEQAFAEDVATGLFGETRFRPAENPIPGAEDFSYVLEEVPGAFMFLGACPPGTDPLTAPYNHSAEAAFDDSVLTEGTALYAELAVRRLTAAAAAGR
ncbi:MAG TPA: M20 family metallopeptidase [Streptosporangiaceae bacterium]